MSGSLWTGAWAWTGSSMLDSTWITHSLVRTLLWVGMTLCLEQNVIRMLWCFTLCSLQVSRLRTAGVWLGRAATGFHWLPSGQSKDPQAWLSYNVAIARLTFVIFFLLLGYCQDQVWSELSSQVFLSLSLPSPPPCVTPLSGCLDNRNPD